jgi:hypothetical protein
MGRHSAGGTVGRPSQTQQIKQNPKHLGHNGGGDIYGLISKQGHNSEILALKGTVSVDFRLLGFLGL